MGGVSSVCEAWFEESTSLRKSSLNPKYTNEKRNTMNTSKGPHNRSMNESPLKTEASSASKSRGHSLSMDDFSIIKVLGRGSYGKIFLVQKKTNKKYYALKVIKKHDLKKPGLRQNIMTEKDVLMQARHPYIVRLKYAFQNESRIYMVMDFCQGGELFLRLKRVGKFDEEVVKFYTAEVILALQYLHEKLNIIHRDLKPENILLCSDGHIKVTDFGLSKVSNRTYSICGTPEYIAPEVILRQGYGKLVDWWSLGCLMFEMMTGHPPFSSEDRDELSNDILLKNAKLPKEMSEEARDIISKLLAKDPSQRLGVNGIEEIKGHAFFKSIDWDAMMKKKISPPFIPEVKSHEDVSNFYKTYTNEPPKETPILRPKGLDERADDFPSFSYLDDTMSELPSMSHVDKDNILGSIVDERKLSVKLE